MARSGSQSLSARDVDAGVQAFLDTVAKVPVRADRRRGRLVFALDATASREPTWDTACHLQGAMFQAAAEHGGLDIQLVFYRGFHECKAGRWTPDTDRLLTQMTGVRCLGGHTQIERTIRHVLKERGKGPVDAFVFVGDALEEDIDAVCHAAGELGLAGVPAFMFQEDHNPTVRRCFQQVAKLTGGAFAPFDRSSPDTLKALMAAVAVFAAGGHRALKALNGRAGPAVKQLTHQVKA